MIFTVSAGCFWCCVASCWNLRNISCAGPPNLFFILKWYFLISRSCWPFVKTEKSYLDRAVYHYIIKLTFIKLRNIHDIFLFRIRIQKYQIVFSRNLPCNCWSLALKPSCYIISDKFEGIILFLACVQNMRYTPNLLNQRHGSHKSMSII